MEHGDQACTSSSEKTALAAARELYGQMPAAVAKKYGDVESYEWWEQHTDLFEEARQEWGMLCPAIYDLIAPFSDGCGGKMPPASRWLRPHVQSSLQDGSPAALRSVLQEVCCDSVGHKVYRVELFTDEFCDLLLTELDHFERSKIPLRRPNGMNRYGAILSHLGFQERLLEPLVQAVVQPFARELWPEWVGAADCTETYGFVVRYRVGEDVDLALHADTSNVTLNACLGREFEGGDLYFKGVRFTGSADDAEEWPVAHRRGSALIHLGGHFHGVRPLANGDRSNLVLWATGSQGMVRIRPTTPHEGGCKAL